MGTCNYDDTTSSSVSLRELYGVVFGWRRPVVLDVDLGLWYNCSVEREVVLQ